MEGTISTLRKSQDGALVYISCSREYDNAPSSVPKCRASLDAVNPIDSI